VPRPVFALLSLLSVWWIGYEAADTVWPALAGTLLYKNITSDVVFELAGLALVVRGIRGERGWLLMGVGALFWGAGDVYWSLQIANLSSPPVPSWADAGYLCFCPFTFAGIFSLLRNRRRDADRTLVTDAAAAALATGALSAALVVHPVLTGATGGTLSIATNLAYPLCDLILIGLIVAASALADWRLNRTLLLLGASVITFWIADSLYLIADATNTYQEHAWYNPLWYCAPILSAWAAWLPAAVRRGTRSAQSARGIMMLLGFAGLAMGILVYSSVRPVGWIAISLATGSLLVVMGRLVMTWRDNVYLLHLSQAEAITDALTGLRNRRALIRDLEASLHRGSKGRRLALVLLDLDGFKHYNDDFGHPAGDSLLERLGSNLAEAVGAAGTAYRMGGDEFCALVELEPAVELEPGEGNRVIERAAASLHEQGEGFSIGCSYGSVLLPEEASDAESALRIADQRMYAQKRRGRVSASTQSKDVLLRALAERNPDLGNHLQDVADLAAATAASLGLPADEVEQVRHAAELHDVGKVAIPDAILDKPGSLEPGEWAFIRRHTLIGERIITAAPALKQIGALVRSSHENFDGSGYPDGLAGEKIPLGSRIILVCDAFDAMTTDRPYRRAMSAQAATDELRRCAGAQFDPAVVERFAAAVARSPLTRVAVG
jgi:diguanylate cyclase (GGDEF)-like protein